MTASETTPQATGDRPGDTHAEIVLADTDGDGVYTAEEARDLAVPEQVYDAEVVAELEPVPPVTAWGRVISRPVLVVRAVRTSPVPARSGRATLRHSLTVVQGLESWATRAWDAGTMGVYRRQIKAAEAAGDQEKLEGWVDRKRTATSERHQRLMDLPVLLLGLLKVLLVLLAVIPAAVLLVAILAQVTHVGRFLGVITGALSVIRWCLLAIALTWTPFLMAVPFLLVLAAWREGKRRGAPPGWLATAAEADQDVAIDEPTIVRALGALRIPQISSYLKAGVPMQFIVTARQDGRGTHAVLRLPVGVTAERIAKRRADLATGLYRLAKEVWPKTGSEAGVLDLWVADKGALAEGAGPYPLLHDGMVDVFKGVPAGRTLRGDPMFAPIIGRNTICGGMPDQGKSTAARTMMAGCALDPTAELRIWIPDANYDFEAFKPRCSNYIMGAEGEYIEQIRNQLEALKEEIQYRGQLLIQHGEPEVTRLLANANVGLHPLICLLEEAHVAIRHATYGKDISQLLTDNVKLGRKRGIHLITSTQAPSRGAIPSDVTQNCSNGIAFAVGDWVANDALLGQGAYSAGHRATELIPGTDRGTSVVKGFTGQRSEILQWYYINVAKGRDQITPIIERALVAIAARGVGLPGADVVRPTSRDARDLLEDLDEVLGAETMPVADVPALLKRLDPHYLPYRTLTGKGLRSLLAAEQGIKIPSTGNRYPLDPAVVREALARRATADLDENRWSA